MVKIVCPLNAVPGGDRKTPDEIYPYVIEKW